MAAQLTAGTGHGEHGRPGLVRLLVPSHLTGVIGAIIGYVLGMVLSYRLGSDYPAIGDAALQIAFLGLLVGWLLGVGAFELPWKWVTGRVITQEDNEELTYPHLRIGRYFRWNTDHKVIGVQYLVLVLVMLASGGLDAMLIRANLLTGKSLLLPPDEYNTVVTMHGMTMIATLFTIIVGPFGNFIMPIMIGARDMAFPRLNALSWHLLAAGVAIFLFIPFLGGDQTGWTTYAPLADQVEAGANAFAFGVLVILLSSAVGAVNIITTIVTMRAPGMTWTRLPVFVWGILCSTILTATAATSINADLLEILLDRGWQTSFFVNAFPSNASDYASAATLAAGGGISWLSENLFWFFGHPEVYLIALPGFGAVLEIVPVFSRKPVFIYRLSVVGMLGVTAISFLVWGHHLFVSGWEEQLRGYYMGTTELISIPTGFIFLAIIGTIWRGRLWLALPMAWVLAFMWTFLIGGVTGIFLSDVPLDIDLHGNFFVVAHFHYVILGSALWGFFAACIYWFPKVTGRYMDETLGWIHFWVVQIGFNVAFLSMFYLGLEGMPRRVADYASKFAFANALASIFAFILGAGMLVFFANVAWSWKFGRIAPANAWGAQTPEWQTPTPVPIENWEHIPVIVADAYRYGEPEEPAAGTTAQAPAGM